MTQDLSPLQVIALHFPMNIFLNSLFLSVFKCPDPLCGKPCVTLRAFRMHAKCVHDPSTQIDPILEEAKANFICKVRGCGKLFVEEQQLDVHFKHHENYTPR